MHFLIVLNKGNIREKRAHGPCGGKEWAVGCAWSTVCMNCDFNIHKPPLPTSATLLLILGITIHTLKARV